MRVWTPAPGRRFPLTITGRRGRILFPRSPLPRISFDVWGRRHRFSRWNRFPWFQWWYYYNILNRPVYTLPVDTGLPELGYVDPSWDPEDIDQYIEYLEDIYRTYVVRGYRIIVDPLSYELQWIFQPRVISSPTLTPQLTF